MGAVRRKFGMMTLFVGGIIVALNILMPSFTDPIYIKNYIVDSICLIVVAIMYVLGWLLGKYDFFSPITFFSCLYVFMFFITPIYDILTGQILWFGKDLFQYGILGSIYALIGYICFYLAYIFSFRVNSKETIINCDFEKNECTSSSRMIVLIVLGYCVCLMVNIYYMVKSGGHSILYVLTLGLLGNGDTGVVVSNLGAISMLSYSLPSFTLMYCEYGNSKFLKVLFFILMFQLQVANGFRFIVIQIIITFVFYWRLSKNKPLKVGLIISVFLLLLVSIVIMTLFRNEVRNGSGINMKGISLKSIKEALDAAFWDNLRIYKNFYAIIMVVPEKTPHLLGKQMIIYTIIMLIPRAIWTSKPGKPGTEAIKISLGMAAVKGGTAFPCIGEYYYDFGLAGILIFMTIFGLWVKKYERKLRFHNNGKIDLMKYCTLVGLILQLVIRGYTPSNFWLVVFCLIPYWFIENYKNVYGNNR